MRNSKGAGPGNRRIHVPLSLVMKPDLPEALLGKQQQGQPSSPMPSSIGDGLNTGMALPTDSEVVNMADLSKEEFLGIIRQSGLKVTK